MKKILFSFFLITIPFLVFTQDEWCDIHFNPRPNRNVQQVVEQEREVRCIDEFNRRNRYENIEEYKHTTHHQDFQYSYRIIRFNNPEPATRLTINLNMGWHSFHHLHDPWFHHRWYHPWHNPWWGHHWTWHGPWGWHHHHWHLRHRHVWWHCHWSWHTPHWHVAWHRPIIVHRPFIHNPSGRSTGNFRTSNMITTTPSGRTSAVVRNNNITNVSNRQAQFSTSANRANTRVVTDRNATNSRTTLNSQHTREINNTQNNRATHQRTQQISQPTQRTTNNQTINRSTTNHPINRNVQPINHGRTSTFDSGSSRTPSRSNPINQTTTTTRSSSAAQGGGATSRSSSGGATSGRR